MQYKWCLALISFQLMLSGCQHFKQYDAVASVIHAYKLELDTVSKETSNLIQLIQENANTQQLLQQFKITRVAYKQTEWLAEYYYPYTAKSINGPALPEVEADEKNIIIQPEGFQVIEELLLDSVLPDKQSELLKQANILLSNIGRLKYMLSNQETTNAHIFDALHLEIFRIITLGITGFDSPVIHNSLPEAVSSLESIQHVLSFYQESLKHNKKTLVQQLQEDFSGAFAFISSAKDFNSLDRMTLITKYLNHISENISLSQKVLGIPYFSEPRVLQATASTLFAKDIFNADYYTANTASYSSPAKVKLGEKLFYDGILSGDGKRSCATCHQPQKAFTDGLKTSISTDGNTSTRRNAPTLINAALQTSLFYDMRVNYLEDQAKDVINNKDEMHGSFSNALMYIKADTLYKAIFNSVYQNEAISESHIKNSIAAYIRSLTAMNSRFDQFMRGNYTAMNQSEITGFNIFAGKAKCATCHFIPLFNGSNPPGFDKIDAEVIGVPATADSLHPVLDQDEGKFSLYKIDLHKNAFKTPTLRNIALTAPYMHNGVFKDLEEVVEFYNRGGGIGLGLQIDNQTLPSDKLDLTIPEKQSLVNFMKSLTDTTFAGRRTLN